MSVYDLQGSYIKSKKNVDLVKAEVIDYARQKWSKFFSKFFNVTKIAGKK